MSDAVQDANAKVFATRMVGAMAAATEIRARLADLNTAIRAAGLFGVEVEVSTADLRSMDDMGAGCQIQLQISARV